MRRALASLTRRLLGRGCRGLGKMPDPNYNHWTKAGLIERVRELEALSSTGSSWTAGSTCPVTENGAKPGKRKMDPSRYSTRYIALKFAYLGQSYGGFEFQPSSSQPTIEEELWKALTKTCLVFPEGDAREVDFDCCEYSKCGRTDRGVSAFGQVVGLRVRSNRPSKRAKLDEASSAASAESAASESTCFDDILDEIPYPHVLNRILPKDIRVLAWCPSPPAGFSARFSCRERQYRYFFTQPAFAPAPNHSSSSSSSASASSAPKAGWLDIQAMRDAAKRFEGEHDFRNFCKIDPAKQITNFRRNIFEADIVQVADAASALPFLAANGPFGSPQHGDTSFPKVYYFHVRGSAFLWHQIRHMVAVLFLVGQGLESPHLVSELLDVATNPRRPNYVMADEVPLVLWDCVFPDLEGGGGGGGSEDALQWVRVGDEGRHQSSVMDDAWQLWRGSKMDELLAGQLLQRIAEQDPRVTNEGHNGGQTSIKTFHGGNGGRMSGRHVPVMHLKLLDSVEEQNEKYARRKNRPK